jgi:hypothetical protein
MFESTGPDGSYTAEQMADFYKEVLYCCGVLQVRPRIIFSGPLESLFYDFLVLQEILVEKDKLLGHAREPVTGDTLGLNPCDPYVFEFVYNLHFNEVRHD